MGIRTSILSVLAAALGLTAASEAKAWYFPEHAEATRIALTHYVPAVAVNAIQRAVDEVTRCVPEEPHRHPAERRQPCKPFSGLPICPDVGLPLASTPLASATGAKLKRPDLGWLTTEYATCIPFGALPALAADHAVDVEGLEQLLTVDIPRPIMRSLTVAGMVTGASVEAWVEFRTAAPIEFARAFDTFRPNGGGAEFIDTTMNRRKLTRDLDARLLLVDHDYTSRAAGSKSHFQNSLKMMSEIVDDLKSVGTTDNALAQMLSHHMRSMVLAIRGRREKQPLYTSQAILEHAFAVHFMQDAFAAGHIGTEHGITNPTDRLQRHDYLSRRGLAVHRALSRRSCPPTKADTNQQHGELPYCWTAHGDGYLDIDNIPYLAEATARLQVELAFALRGPEIRHELFKACGAGEKCVPLNVSAQKQIIELGERLDPTPSWTYTPPDQGPDKRGDLWQRDVIVGVLEALDKLERAVAADAIDVTRSIKCGREDGAQTQAATLARHLTGEAFRPCNSVCTSPPDNDLRRGDIDVSLWRPLLVVWPTSQADVRTLDGRDSFGRGIAFQVGYGVNVSAVFDAAGVLGAGVSGGLAYRADSLLPGRDNRAILEVNVGIAPSLVFGLPRAASASTSYATVLFGEVRVPLFALATLLGGYITRSANSVDPVRTPVGVGIYGMRAYFLLPSRATSTDNVPFLGWDLEVAHVVLGRDAIGRTASAGVLIAPELRLRIGRAQFLSAFTGNPSHQLTIGLDLAGGFSWFL